MTDKKLDPFYISKIVVTFFQEEPKKGCMYSTLYFGDYRHFDGTSNEIEELATGLMKLSDETKSLKVITVYGFENYDSREVYLENLKESIEYELDGRGDDYWGEQEEECYSFFLDHRK